ncbi:hypothetical protein N9W34_00440 [Rickettsiales bacterium]|nr:hypothetical protein [Rickettsiales bacterium]
MKQSKKKLETVREAVAVFNDADSLQAALDDLQTYGFERRHFSVLADAKTIKKKFGHIYKHVEKEEDDPKAPRTIFVPLESIGEGEGALTGFPLYVVATTATAMVVASGGTLLAAITAAIAAGAVGASFGGLYAWMLGQHHADYIKEQIEHGGLLLWVQTDGVIREKWALKILKKHSAHDVHIHDIAI